MQSVANPALGRPVRASEAVHPPAVQLHPLLAGTTPLPTIPDLAAKLIDANLCNLVASIDEATQETYEKYRRGGNAEVAFERIREIADLKRKRRSPLPWITAKFLVFDHNWHEIGAFKERAIEAGANDALFVSGFANGRYDTGRAATEVEFDLNALAWTRRELPHACPSGPSPATPASWFGDSWHPAS
jgi:hypothetical protein